MQESNLPRRQYTDEFKIEAIRLAESIGGHEAARRLRRTSGPGGQLEATSDSCRHARRCDAASCVQRCSRVHTPPGELEAENSRLRRELADVKLDVEIPRKATAYFAKGSR